jgi:hypothetical protein
MSEVVISGLVRKRADIAAEIERLRAQMLHIDATLRVFGIEDPYAILPHAERKGAKFFKSGALIAFVGEAERAGLTDNVSITNWIIQNGHADPNRFQQLRDAVKSCRRRLNKRATSSGRADQRC